MRDESEHIPRTDDEKPDTSDPPLGCYLVVAAVVIGVYSHAITELLITTPTYWWTVLTYFVLAGALTCAVFYVRETQRTYYAILQLVSGISLGWQVLWSANAVSRWPVAMVAFFLVVRGFANLKHGSNQLV